MENDLPPGWSIPVGIYIGLVILMLACFWLGIPLVFVLPVIGLIDVVVTTHFLSTSVKRLLRLGVFGPLRARWWLLMAAVVVTIGMATFTFWIAFSSFGFGMLPAWQRWLFGLAVVIHDAMRLSFVVLATMGFLMGILQRKSVRGRAIELVSFFLLIELITAVSYAIPGWVQIQILTPALVLFSLIAGIAAAYLHFKNRAENQLVDL